MTSAPESEGTTTAAAGMSPPLPQLQQARRDFLTLVEKLRPDLHRYCARMVGSAIDGEDVVQDTLARGYYELSALREPPALRAWLFRIAHNRALDYLRRSDRRSEPLDLDTEEFIDRASDPDILLPREQAVTFAVARFSELAPTQRSCVILKDVLDYSLEEISDSLEISVPAVKAALHRGRARLQVISAQADAGGFDLPPEISPAVRRYAELFNARDWDGVRAMLIDDVRLEVVDATSRRGRKEVGVYFHNYDGRTNWYMVPARLDGREGLAVQTSADSTRAINFIELTVHQDQIARIRDFHHVPYLTADAQMQHAAIAKHCQ
jgi:RNA polymerase sigma factor (sigma-70 family)